jgi:hypothetical protein
MIQECYRCRGLGVLADMAKEAEYRGPKIPLCKNHVMQMIN